MVTAVMDEGIGKEALEKGADEYITKPGVPPKTLPEKS